jgi:hypothetical protein
MLHFIWKLGFRFTARCMFSSCWHDFYSGSLVLHLHVLHQASRNLRNLLTNPSQIFPLLQLMSQNCHLRTWNKKQTISDRIRWLVKVRMDEYIMLLWMMVGKQLLRNLTPLKMSLMMNSWNRWTFAGPLCHVCYSSIIWLLCLLFLMHWC